MGFRLLILAPPKGHYGDYVNEGWPESLQELIPDIDVSFCRTTQEAAEKIEEADAAFGEIDAELFARAKNLRWIASPLAGPRAGYYHRALIESDVTVTNVRGVYSDHISAHIMAFVLSFARGLHAYVPQQLRRMWRPGHETVYLPGSDRRRRRGRRHRRRDGQTLFRVRYDCGRGRCAAHETAARGSRVAHAGGA